MKFRTGTHFSRRDLLKAASISAVSARAFAEPSPSSVAGKPNVLVVVMDDLGCHDFGCLGAKDLKTPHIDGLAANGARFTNWYSNAPVCAPARSSILSGRFPANAGVPNNGGRLTPGIANLASVLKQNGYRTAAIGKWHLGSDAETCPNSHGFDYFYGFQSGCVDYYSHRYYWGSEKLVNYHDLWRNREEIFEDGQYLTERIAAETVSFIDRSRNNPFFAYVAFNAPHYPMHAPAKYTSRFANLPLERRIYAAMIAAVDDGVGAIMRALESQGAVDNTLIFLLGDNGATTEARAGLNQDYARAGDNGPFKGFKFSLFDGGMHVPAMVHWPARVKPQQIITEQAMSMDILPTVCEAIGAPIPAGVDGSSVLNVLTKGAKSPHDALFWSQGGQLAVRRGRWKLVLDGRLFDRRPEGRAPLTGDDAVWLSDVEQDPGESRNLRHVNPNVADELSTLAHRWQATLKKKQ